MRKKSLYNAVKKGDCDKIELLIKNGVDVNALISRTRGSALHVACEKGRTKVVSLLLAAPGVKVNLPDSEGRTPFHIACERGFREIVGILLDVPDININAQTVDGYSPLHSASKHDKRHVLEILLAHKNTLTDLKDLHGRTFFHYIISHAKLDTVNYVLSILKDDHNTPDNDGMTALHLACIEGDPKTIIVLLKNPSIRIDIADKYGNTALDYLDRIFRNRSIYLDGNLLLIAISEIQGFDINHQFKIFGKTLLHWCCEIGNVEILKKLLILKADHTMRDIFGRTALHIACLHSNDQLIAPLVNAGAKVFIKDNKPRFMIGFAGNLSFFEHVEDDYPGGMILSKRNESSLATLRELSTLIKCCTISVEISTKALQIALEADPLLTSKIICRLFRHEEGTELRTDQIVGILKAVILSQFGTTQTQPEFCQLVAIECYGIMALYNTNPRALILDESENSTREKSEFENSMQAMISPTMAQELKYLIIALLCVNAKDSQANTLLGMTLLSLHRPGKDPPFVPYETILGMLDVDEKITTLQSILSLFENNSYIEQLKSQLVGWLDISIDEPAHINI